MTEKRFKVLETITHDDRRIYELTKNDIGYYNFKGEMLLAHMICNELNKLLEENEQLKQRNDRQAKRLAELYELMAKKDWESLTEIIDDFCSCEEQLQRESGTYGGFE